jgi:hypothetical protein
VYGIYVRLTDGRAFLHTAESREELQAIVDYYGDSLFVVHYRHSA